MEDVQVLAKKIYGYVPKPFLLFEAGGEGGGAEVIPWGIRRGGGGLREAAGESRRGYRLSVKIQRLLT